MNKKLFENYLEKNSNNIDDNEINNSNLDMRSVEHRMMPDVFNFFSPSNKPLPYLENIKVINQKTTRAGTIFKNYIGLDKNDLEESQLLIYVSGIKTKISQFDMQVDSITKMFWNKSIQEGNDPYYIETNILEYCELLNPNKTYSKSSLIKKIVESLSKFSNLKIEATNFYIDPITKQKSNYLNMGYYSFELNKEKLKIFFDKNYIKKIYNIQDPFYYKYKELSVLKRTISMLLYRSIKEKSFFGEENIVYDIDQLCFDFMINASYKKKSKVFQNQLKPSFEELKSNNIIRDYEYKRGGKILVYLKTEPIIKEGDILYKIQTIKELKQNLVNLGNMNISLYNKIFNKNGIVLLSKKYEIARAIILHKNDNKLPNNYNIQISKMINANFEEKMNLKYQKDIYYQLKFKSLGYEYISKQNEN